jgi:sec-independent protein translocase protein TatC
MRKILGGIWKVLTAPFRAAWWLISLPYRLVKRGVGFLKQEPTERPLGDVLISIMNEKDARQALIEELDAFRMHLLRSLVWLILGVGISFTFNQKVLEFLAIPIGGLQSLKAIDVTESIGVFMKVSLVSGVVLAFMPIFFEFWLFAAPGLRSGEKIGSLVMMPFAALLFVGGMAFCYYVILPNGLPILLNFLGIQSELRPSSYFNFVTNLMFWLGVAFEFPIIIIILTMMKIVKPKMLRDQWRLAVVIITVMAAIITPTVDPVNMFLVMLPSILLYIISILLSYLVVFLQGRGMSKEEPAV